MVLGVDIETYSEVDLPDCGLYRYVDDPSFEVLLIAYAIDDGPVTVLDLTRGDDQTEILKMLEDPDIIKTAYNAAFEIQCLSKHIGHQLDCRQWRCTQVLAATLGLPRSLGEVAKALGFPQDKQKMTAGRQLISYFCKPCKPTKANGGRTRNRPEHASEKWKTFCEYNAQDVVVEREIRNKLAGYEPDDVEQAAWVMDQQINQRGVGIDRQLVDQAIRISNEHSDKLCKEAKLLTGLENPNSVAQLKAFLGVDSLTKAAVAEMRAAGSEHDRLLAIRQEAGKSSVKKYEAIDRCVTSDGKVHGLFQFYGGSRTGRWAGRLVQLQNLPQNHLNDLDLARTIVKEGDLDGLQMLFGSVPNTLSELIRTALIPGEGNTFAVADFAAIEARVIAWMADEKWRLDLFGRGGDIYCQSASQMFGVPVEKHGVNGHLRQKGKIAELACIAENQLVMTDKGLIPIQDVTTQMLVWDGSEWVRHGGVIYKGERDVIEYEGLIATKDHKVFVEGKQEPIRFGIAAASLAHLVCTESGGNPVRLGGGYKSCKEMEQKVEPLLCPDTVRGLRVNPVDGAWEPTNRKVEGLPELLYPTAGLPRMAGTAFYSGQTALHEPEGPQLQELRCERNTVQIPLGEGGVSAYDRDQRPPWAGDGAGQNRCERPLRARESALGDAQRELYKPAKVLGKARVYDILNAGPHHRFTVSGKLVHNCGYGGNTGALINMGALKMGLTEDELPGLVEAWRNANPGIVALWKEVGDAVMRAVRDNIEVELPKGMRVWRTNKLLHIRLPSGRCIRYYDPGITENRFGHPSIDYQGYQTNGPWGRVESYGPKFVENIVQATARDCLRDSMLAVSKKYPDIVMHIHDEMVAEVPKDGADEALKEIQSVMGQPVAWAPGLLLRGDGYLTDYYRKD